MDILLFNQKMEENPSLSRRGDFQTNENGELLDGAGNKILDGGLNH